MWANNRFHTDGGEFSLPEEFCQLKWVIANPEFGSEFATAGEAERHINEITTKLELNLQPLGSRFNTKTKSLF
jgi:hypothetical protein